MHPSLSSENDKLQQSPAEFSWSALLAKNSVDLPFEDDLDEKSWLKTDHDSPFAQDRLFFYNFAQQFF